ncbi:MAG: hypothetical protein ACJ788_16340 [Ktedonobacteraceae bacterium]|jgi:hypothetical protein
MLPEIQGRIGQKSLSRLFVVLSLGLLLLVIGVGLGACGSNSTGSAGPTPTTPTQAQKCGTVQTKPNGDPLNPTSAQQTTGCFWQAFRQCHPATLVYTAAGVDTVTTRTFNIQNNGEQCSIVDVVKHQVIPAPATTAKTYTCSGLTQQSDGLHFASCGTDGNIIVPSQALHH